MGYGREKNVYCCYPTESVSKDDSSFERLPLNKEKFDECWVAVFNATTNELLVKCKDPDHQIETKYYRTNAFNRTPHRKNQKQLKSIPGYSVYGTSFNVCDRYNRA